MKERSHLKTPAGNKNIAKAGRTKGQSAVNRYCTASKLDEILLNSRFQLVFLFLYSAVVPGWTSNEYPAFGNTRSLAAILKTHYELK
jgi:hypothetical protein